MQRSLAGVGGVARSSACVAPAVFSREAACRMRRRGACLLSGIALAVLATTSGIMSITAAAPSSFGAIVVFGDSLSDAGNAGRASNGPVWVEQLASLLSVTLKPARVGGTNYAVGGAHLNPRSGPYNLRAQADVYLNQARPKGRILHIVYGGGNDLLAAAQDRAALALVDAAIASLRSIVADLVAKRGGDILVPTLPDVGLTPAIRSHGSETAAEARKLSEHFNRGIDRVLAEPAGAAIRIHRLDVWDMAERTRAVPSASGFKNITQPCAHLRTCEGYLFWDNVHPTTAAHRRLAEAALAVLTQIK
jgi:phospholipase/lecithinase/hemolysin